MEYIEYGDLGDHLGQWLPENEVQLITGQLLQGLAHIHTNGFTHRDLKPNVSGSCLCPVANSISKSAV